MGTIGTAVVFIIGGAVLVFCCVAGAFKIRDFRQQTKYLKSELEQCENIEEQEYWEEMLKNHYARVNPLYRIKK